MPELNVTINRTIQTIPFERGDKSVSLKELMDGSGVSVASECGGVGKCGFCLVAVMAGDCSPLTPAEQSTLSEDEIRDGYRLSCQVRPLGDVQLSMDAL